MSKGIGRAAKTTPERISAKEKQRHALELRKSGLTFEEIAKVAGYNSAQAAHAAVSRALKEIIKDPAEELRKLELERLDKLQVKAFMNALRGSESAAQTVLKIMHHRAKLLGLYAPETTNISMTGSALTEKTDDELRKIIAAGKGASAAKRNDAADAGGDDGEE